MPLFKSQKSRRSLRRRSSFQCAGLDDDDSLSTTSSSTDTFWDDDDNDSTTSNGGAVDSDYEYASTKSSLRESLNKTSSGHTPSFHTSGVPLFAASSNWSKSNRTSTSTPKSIASTVFYSLPPPLSKKVQGTPLESSAQTPVLSHCHSAATSAIKSNEKGDRTPSWGSSDSMSRENQDRWKALIDAVDMAEERERHDEEDNRRWSNTSHTSSSVSNTTKSGSSTPTTMSSVDVTTSERGKDQTEIDYEEEDDTSSRHVATPNPMDTTTLTTPTPHLMGAVTTRLVGSSPNYRVPKMYDQSQQGSRRASDPARNDTSRIKRKPPPPSITILNWSSNQGREESSRVSSTVPFPFPGPEFTRSVDGKALNGLSISLQVEEGDETIDRRVERVPRSCVPINSKKVVTDFDSNLATRLTYDRSASLPEFRPLHFSSSRQVGQQTSLARNSRSEQQLKTLEGGDSDDELVVDDSRWATLRAIERKASEDIERRVANTEATRRGSDWLGTLAGLGRRASSLTGVNGSGGGGPNLSSGRGGQRKGSSIKGGESLMLSRPIATAKRAAPDFSLFALSWSSSTSTAAQAGNSDGQAEAGSGGPARRAGGIAPDDVVTRSSRGGVLEPVSSWQETSDALQEVREEEEEGEEDAHHGANDDDDDDDDQDDGNALLLDLYLDAAATTTSTTVAEPVRRKWEARLSFELPVRPDKQPVGPERQALVEEAWEEVSGVRRWTATERPLVEGVARVPCGRMAVVESARSR